MFDDQQTNQSDNTNNDLGVGTHPSLVQQQPEPQVVLPNPSGVPPTTSSTTPTDDTAQTSSSDTSDLDSIQSQALAQLSPLVNKLDQTPEERYKTLMMLIQASDNQDLLADAYKAAQDISDETAKAEALLGIVNEINYFKQKQA